MNHKSGRKRSNAKSGVRIIPQTNKWRNPVIIGLIILLTFTLFSKSLYYTFIGYDDPQYILDNNLIKDLSFKGLKEIFTTPVMGMYNPLTFVVYSLEYKLFGLDPKGYHFFNLLFHLIATVMAYKFIFKLTGRYETATIVALFFAIHPMHVEVVTWVSQTKTSLCVIFYFSALFNYLKYSGDNYKLKYLLYAGLFFILAALSKPTAVTIAPMLFLLDYYLSRKFDKKLILEKIPFIIISLFFGVLTLLTHEGDSIFRVNEGYSLLDNVLIANYSVVFYFQKLFLPIKMSFIYPYPDNSVYLPLQYYLSIPVIPLILLLIYKAGKFRKEMVFGILFFTISISVLIRIVPSGFFSAANRYSYLSYTGLFFIIGQFVTYILDNKFSFSWKIRSYIIPSLILLVVFFCYRATVRINKWKDGVTLFSDVIEKYPYAPVAYANRGYARALKGDHQAAWVDYNMALSLDSETVQVYLNRAITEAALKKYKEALADLNVVMDASPEFGAGYYDRGLVKTALFDTLGALMDFKKAESLGITQASEQIRLLNPGTN